MKVTSKNKSKATILLSRLGKLTKRQLFQRKTLSVLLRQHRWEPVIGLAPPGSIKVKTSGMFLFLRKLNSSQTTTG